MRDPPGPGLEPVSPALAGRLSTAAPPGKPNFWYICDYIAFQFLISILFWISFVCNAMLRLAIGKPSFKRVVIANAYNSSEFEAGIEIEIPLLELLPYNFYL